jgi:hypothetical protein
LQLLYLSINIFLIGGDEFVYDLNSFLVSPLAIMTSILAATLWRQMKDGAQSRVLWGGLFLGWVCWAVAETLWAGYSLTGADPYPSWADFFFLIGYLPMSVGFISRMVRLPRKTQRGQQLLVWLISLVTISVTTFFILLPILQEYDPELVLESLLGIFYPLADLFLLLLVLNLLFTYGPGDYGLAWRLILVGFVAVVISDLFFSYADWNGLYYPDGEANLISTILVDFLYSAAYVLWTLGIYTLRILLREHHIHKIDFQPRLTTNAHVLLFTNRHGIVGEVSRNYYRLFLLENPIGKPFAEALGISNQQGETIHHKLIAGKTVTDLSICMESPAQESRDGWLCGLPIMDSPNDYSGSILLLRVLLDGEADTELSEYQKSMVPFVLQKSGSTENKSIRLLLLDYHLAYIKSLFNLSLREGGAAMSQALLEELQVKAEQNDWQMRFNPQTILESDMESPARLSEALGMLTESAKQFTSRLTDPATVAAEMQRIDAQFSEAIHSTVAGLRTAPGSRSG